MALASRQFDLTPNEIEGESSKVSAGWRTRCGPNLKTCASTSSRTWRKPTAKPCWNWAPEKSWQPWWARTRAEGLDPAGPEGRRVRRLDGRAVPLVRCGPAQLVPHAAQGSAEGEAGAGRTDQSHDRGRAVVRISDGGRTVGDEQAHGAADLSDQLLAGAQTGRPGIETLP